MDYETVRQFFETMPVMMLSVKTEGGIEFVSNHWLARLGFSRDEVIGRPYCSFLTTESQEKVSTDRDLNNFPVHLITESGVEVDALLSTTRELDTSGDVVRVRMVFQDMTELNALLQTLESANEELAQFAYVASHDLQEPLRTITSFVEILRDDLEEKLTEEDEENLNYVCTAASRLRDLVLGLLDFSRINTKAGELVTGDLTEVAKKAAHDVVNGWNWVSVEPLPEVPMDKSQIYRVFVNLFSNSVKYAQQGEDPDILVYAVENDSEVIVSVQDNGRGIEAEYHEMVLQPFKRLHTQQTIKGTGIGLAIVKKIIERHGGSLWVESEGHNKGTTIRFILPK